jgi:hypothetical protein
MNNDQIFGLVCLIAFFTVPTITMLIHAVYLKKVPHKFESYEG